MTRFSATCTCSTFRSSAGSLYLAILLVVASLISSPAGALAAPPRVSAPNFILIDSSTGQVLIEQASNDKAYPASTTKIATACVVLSRANLADRITVPKEARVGGSNIFLGAGSQISVEDALYALMLSSANDSAVTLAHAVSGSVPAFAQEMNKFAKEAGATDTNFANPHGLPDDNHYTTALDLALVAKAALSNSTFRKIAGTQTREVTITGDGERRETLTNHNRMLWWYDGCTGMKTGFTNQSRQTIVASAMRNGRELIAVALGSSSSTAMWRDAALLLDLGFASFRPKEVVTKGQRLAEAPVIQGRTQVEAGAAASLTFLSGDSVPELVVRPVFDQDLRAPLRAGQKVGVAVVTQRGRELGRVDMVSRQDVAKVSIISSINVNPAFYTLPLAALLSLLALGLSRRAQRRLLAQDRTPPRPRLWRERRSSQNHDRHSSDR